MPSRLDPRTLSLLASACILLTACNRQLPDLPYSMLPEPDPASVESVFYFFGDAGYASTAHDPVLHVLRNDIEFWAAALARDSAVRVLFLGDAIYPVGLRTGQPAYFQRDSAIAQSQIDLVDGPAARRFNAIGYFLAGNHDWGQSPDASGLDRLRNFDEFLHRRAAAGYAVMLQPESGQPGPAVIDVGRTRLLLFDTAWWLLAREDYLKQRSFQQTRDAISSAGDRVVIVAAHHPFHSTGAHSGLVPFWKTLGVRFLLNRSGAVLQDLSSIAYQELRRSLMNAFTANRPLIFAGGHDHSLQVIEADSAPEPRFSIVSGSGSKISTVGHAEGMRYRNAAPGYMRVMVHHDGRVDLFVIAAPDRDYLTCRPLQDEALAACMNQGIAAFRIFHGQRLQ